MTRLKNPFSQYPGYNCFGCSPANPQGLRLEFTEEGDDITSTWNPTKDFQGYHNVLHGGIQATLLDEIASWVVYVKLKRAGVTSSMNVRYHKAIKLDDGPLKLVSSLKGMRRNLADIKAVIYNNRNELCASAEVTYFTFPEDKSREELYYPGHSEFYP